MCEGFECTWPAINESPGYADRDWLPAYHMWNQCTELAAVAVVSPLQSSNISITQKVFDKSFSSDFNSKRPAFPFLGLFYLREHLHTLNSGNKICQKKNQREPPALAWR